MHWVLPPRPIDSQDLSDGSPTRHATHLFAVVSQRLAVGEVQSESKKQVPIGNGTQVCLLGWQTCIGEELPS